MTSKLELYKCNICGNLVQVLISGVGELVCCGEAMKLMTPKNSFDDIELTEKHSPVLECDENNKVVVKIPNHPMIKEHYIMFVESISSDEDEIRIQYFHPNQEVIMTNCIDNKNQKAQSYCNIHGLYVNKKEG